MAAYKKKKNLVKKSIWNKYNQRKNDDDNELLVWSDEPYNSYLTQKIIEKHLVKDNKKKILEIGCAPGSKLIYFNKKFGYKVYGIEKFKQGCEQTKNNLKKAKIQSKIYQYDFFDKKFQNKFRNKFDVILDYGFIEHFNNTKEIIEYYWNLLKKDGVIISVVPNYQYLNKLLAYIINKKELYSHNLNILEKNKFQSLFNDQGFKKKCCEYIGTFYCDYQSNNLLFFTKNRVLQTGIGGFQKTINKLLKILPRFESRLISPHIIYMGKKTKK